MSLLDENGLLVACRSLLASASFPSGRMMMDDCHDGRRRRRRLHPHRSLRTNLPHPHLHLLLSFALLLSTF